MIFHILGLAVVVGAFDYSFLPPLATIIAAIVTAFYASRGVRAANKLSGQDQLNQNLQQDNEIQRRLTNECNQRCSVMEREIQDLRGAAWVDDLIILELEGKLSQMRREFDEYRMQHP